MSATDEVAIEELNKQLDLENEQTDQILSKIEEAINKNNIHLENIKKYVGEQSLLTNNTELKRLLLKVQTSLSKSQLNNITTDKLIKLTIEKANIYNPVIENTQNEEDQEGELPESNEEHKPQ